MILPHQILRYLLPASRVDLLVAMIVYYFLDVACSIQYRRNKKEAEESNPQLIS